MRFHQLRLLTDENMSPKIGTFLGNRGIDVSDVKKQGWQGGSDDEPLEIAYRESRWVLTHDADFGASAIHEDKPFFGIVFLRIRDLKPHNVVRVCSQLLHHDMNFSEHAPVVVEEARIHIRQVNED